MDLDGSVVPGLGAEEFQGRGQIPDSAGGSDLDEVVSEQR
jgi:hypothetical protein